MYRGLDVHPHALLASAANEEASVQLADGSAAVDAMTLFRTLSNELAKALLDSAAVSARVRVAAPGSHDHDEALEQRRVDRMVCKLEDRLAHFTRVRPI